MVTKAELTQELFKLLDNESLTIEELKNYLDQGVDINACNKENELSIIALAVQNSQLDLVEFLVEKGADINVLGGNGKQLSIMRFAVKQNSLDLVEALIKKDININNVIKNTSALHLAIKERQENIIVHLIQQGVDLETTGRDGNNALHLAIKVKFNELAKFLILDLKVNSEIPDKDGNTALHLAIKAGLNELATILLLDENIDKTRQNNIGTPLHTAILANNLDIVRLLLDLKADINIKTKPIPRDALAPINAGKRYTALELAVDNESTNIIDYIFSKFVINEDQQRNLLTIAMYDILRSKTMINKLIKHGVQVSYDLLKSVISPADKLNKLFIHTHLEKIKILLQKCPKLERYQLDDLLQRVIKQPKIGELVEILIDKGAKVDDHTLEQAVVKGNYLAVEYLLDNKDRFNITISQISVALKTLLSSAEEISVNQIIILNDFLKKELVNLSKEEATKILHLLPKDKYTYNYDCLRELVKILVEEKEANINIQDHQGKTLLHKAAEMKSFMLIADLIDYDANIHIRDKQGRSALYSILCDPKATELNSIIDNNGTIIAKNRYSDLKQEETIKHREDNIQVVVNTIVERYGIKDKIDINLLRIYINSDVVLPNKDGGSDSLYNYIMGNDKQERKLFRDYAYNLANKNYDQAAQQLEEIYEYIKQNDHEQLAQSFITVQLKRKELNGKVDIDLQVVDTALPLVEEDEVKPSTNLDLSKQINKAEFSNLQKECAQML